MSEMASSAQVGPTRYKGPIRYVDSKCPLQNIVNLQPEWIFLDIGNWKYGEDGADAQCQAFQGRSEGLSNMRSWMKIEF